MDSTPFSEKILIAGAGAVGAALAAQIHSISLGSVHILAEGERRIRYEKQGFSINNIHYYFTIADAHQNVEYELILIAVKSYNLETTLTALKPFVSKKTIILSLINGVSSEQQIAAVYGSCPYAMILGIDAVRTNNTILSSTLGHIHFGESSNPIGAWSDRVYRAEALLRKAGIPCKVPENMLRALWFKYMINMGINQASAILRAPYGEFLYNKCARSLMNDLMQEVVLVANKRGIDLGPTDMQTWDSVLSTLRPDGITSMLQDVLAGRKTEVDIFAGELVHMAKDLNIAVPTNELCLKMITAIQDRKTVL